jgi:hypothetical protein
MPLGARQAIVMGISPRNAILSLSQAAASKCVCNIRDYAMRKGDFLYA